MLKTPLKTWKTAWKKLWNDGETAWKMAKRCFNRVLRAVYLYCLVETDLHFTGIYAKEKRCNICSVFYDCAGNRLSFLWYEPEFFVSLVVTVEMDVARMMAETTLFVEIPQDLICRIEDRLEPERVV